MNLILGWLGNLIGGPFIKAALDAYRAKLALASSEDQRTADLLKRELDIESRERELASQVIIAEQGRWYTALPRPLFAGAFVFYVWWKVVFTDCLGVAHAVNLDPEMASVFKIVLSAYFGGRSLEKIASIIKARK